MKGASKILILKRLYFFYLYPKPVPSIVKHIKLFYSAFIKVGSLPFHTILLKTGATISFLLLFYFNSIPAQTEHDYQIVNSLNQEAWELVESDPLRAKEIVTQILEQTNTINYPEGKAFALNTRGVLLQNDGDYDKAERDFKESLEIRA